MSERKREGRGGGGRTTLHAVPYVIGLTAERARVVLDAAGFGMLPAFRDAELSGYVTHQEPGSEAVFCAPAGFQVLVWTDAGETSGDREPRRPRPKAGDTTAEAEPDRP
ncbi:MAG: hypothetical protein ACRDTZ_04565 [Pseudonocardiaceae bacterium]